MAESVNEFFDDLESKADADKAAGIDTTTCSRSTEPATWLVTSTTVT